MLQNTEPILIEFIKTVKAIHLYPEGHPNLDTILNKAFSEMKALILKSDDHIIWKIDTKGFYEGNMPIGSACKGIDGIGREFFTRRINEIRLTMDLTLPELKNFLHIIKMHPEHIMRLGGIERVLYEAGIKGIWVNEIPYEKLADRLTELGDRKKNLPSLEKEYPDEVHDIHRIKDAHEVVAESLENNSEEKEKGILELLLELDKEYMTPEYLHLLDRILVMAKFLLTEKGQQEDIFSVIMVFAEHAFFKTDRNDEQRTAAKNGIKELVTPETIKYLISRFCKKDEGKKDVIREVFLNTSRECASHLINTLIEADDIHIRKGIFNILVMLGEDARIEAESLLHDGRWFIVRQMVSLVGHIGCHGSLEKLKPLLKHHDMRVKKEVLSAIAKIPLKESLDILIQMLQTKEKDIILHTILLLSSLKDRSSVPFLMALALQKGILHDNTDIRKEALKAVINIGDKTAWAGLIDILKSKAFFRKDKHEELRMLALEAVARIGGKEAIHAIEAVLKNAKNHLKEKCEQILKEIR
ncbi:MAG: HEAT repeat domain-containing protein [Deltaproteobacteria bacterium]|nr:HEAT repeat domain-containing protein [Deltaproteobacteria bacterium]